MNRNDGGPAFPVSRDHAAGYGSCGMTMRDYFAAKAMQGFCANPSAFAPNGMSGWSLVNTDEDRLSGYCYYIADAMLAARGDA